jgi:hypothetical protein
LKTLIDPILNSEQDQSDNILLPSSSYFTTEKFIKDVNNNFIKFSILSLNCQSLNSKFDEIVIFLEQFKQTEI